MSANYNDGEGLQQLSSTVGTIEQRENATTGASERTTNVANPGSSLGSLQVTEIANSNVSSHGSATRSREERLLRLPSTVGSSGQLGNMRTGPSEHAANLSKFDSLAINSLQVVEKATLQFGLLPSPVTKSDIYSIRPTQSTQLGKLGAQAWLRQTTLPTLQTLMYRYIEVCMSYRTMQGRLRTLTRCSAMRNKTLRHVGNPMGAKTVHSLTHPNVLTHPNLRTS